MRALSAFKPFKPFSTRTLTQVQQAIALLRRKSATVWLPGVGSVQGLTAGNYLDSAGVTAATVDNPVGLDLDAMGMLGAEILPALSDVSWASTNAAFAAVGVTAVATACPNAQSFYRISSITSGHTYKYSITISSISAGAVYASLGGVSGVNLTTVGTFTGIIVAGVTGATNIITAGATTAVVTSFSVREVTGIHALQATTANKPVLRRGVVNLLKWSEDFSNAAWTKQAGAIVTQISAGEWEFDLTACADGSGVYAFGGSIAANAFYLLEIEARIINSSGSNAITLQEPTGTDGTLDGVLYLAPQRTLTTAWAKYTVLGQNSATGRVRGIWVAKSAGGALVFRVRYPQLETGSVAHAYVPTTTAPASSATGPYWLDTAAGTKTLGATFPAGNESSIVIDAVTNVGATVLTGQNLTGAYSVYGGVGPELLAGVLNSSAGWALTDALVTGGKLVINTATPFSASYPTGAAVANKKYLVSYTVDAYASGAVRIVCGAAGGTVIASGIGTFTELVTASSTAALAYIQAQDAGFVGSISSIVITEVLPGTSGRIIIPGTIASPATLTAGETALLTAYANRLAGL